jgi:hypothetical protein
VASYGVTSVTFRGPTRTVASHGVTSVASHGEPAAASLSESTVTSHGDNAVDIRVVIAVAAM